MLACHYKCRNCGVRISNGDILKHEILCMERSEEKDSTETGPSNEEDNQQVKNEEKERNAEIPTTQKVSFVAEDDVDDDFWDTGYDDVTGDRKTKSASRNSPRNRHNPLNSKDSKPRNSNDSKPRRTVRSGSGCHAHNSKYSGRRATMPYDRTKPDNLFPPTKKYHYYPVTCDYCWKRFQPNELKAHQRKDNLGEKDEGPRSKRTQSSATKKGYTEEPKRSGPSKSVGSIPRRLQICYICGRMYGSKSLKIHEPKCLDKWRIQNQQLPPNRRAPEPVKPEPIQVSSGGQSLPDFDPVAEAAYLSHLNTLIPCDHCSRTFSPDRIVKHESCCIERPKTKGIRKCKTPTDGKIGR